MVVLLDCQTDCLHSFSLAAMNLAGTLVLLLRLDLVVMKQGEGRGEKEGRQAGGETGIFFASPIRPMIGYIEKPNTGWQKPNTEVRLEARNCVGALGIKLAIT